MHGRVRIVHWHTFLDEHFRRGGFSHTKRTSETENEHWLAVDQLALPQEAKQRQKRQAENSEIVALDALK
jgi:hypothetical protein